MVRTSIFFVSLMCFFNIVKGQVSGVVLDSKTGTPISNVNVILDRMVATRSDGNGRFSVRDLNRKTVLTFRHLSYRDTSINLDLSSERKNLVIYLVLKHETIDEVIVNTGYQTIPKERLTGSFSTVTDKQLESQIGGGITSMLPALANGVMIDNSTGSSNRLVVRGLSTIRAEKKPLIIVDNFPYEGNLDDINPLDIENITVLKDAAASAIWGVRAGNGVIVVTTRKGKFNQKQNFRVSTSYKIGSEPDLERLDIVSSKEFIGLEEYLYNNEFYSSRINNSYKLPLSPIVDGLKDLSEGRISVQDYDALKTRLQTLDVRDEFREHFYSNSIFQQHHLQGNGGSENISWMSSLGMDKEKTFYGAGNDRFTYRLNNNIRIAKNILFSNDISIIHSRSRNGKPIYGDIKTSTYELYPYAEFADGNNTPLAIPQRDRRYIDQVNSEGLLLNWDYYPLEDHRHLKNVRSQWILNWNTGIRYDISRLLNIDLKYNLVLDRTTSENLRDEESFFSRDLVNSFSVLNRSTGQIINNIPKGGILDRSSARRLVHNLRLQMNFDHTTGDHNIYGILGFEGRIYQANGESNRFYGFSSGNMAFGNVDYVTRFPDFTTEMLNSIPNGQFLYSTDTRFVSVFANSVYSYRNKISISGSLRRDATNLFGLRTNDKWNFLWSIGGSWKILDDPNTFLNKMNLRTTYGFSGNVDPALTSANTIKYMGTSVFTNTPIAMFSSYANPDLKWESIRTLNVGSDLMLFKNRVNLSFDWYQKKGNDLYGLALMDPTSGIGASIIRNVAKMRSNGFDISLKLRAIENKDWNLLFQVNLNTTKDKVEDYYLENELGRNFVNEKTISGIEGKPVYSMFSFPWKGLDTDGNPIGYVNGKESKDYQEIFNNTPLDAMRYNGPVMPRWFGAAGGTLGFRSLSVDFRFMYKFGHFIRTRSVDYSALFGQNITHSDYLKRWQNTGDESTTSVPSMIYPLNMNREDYYRFSSVLIESASHIRLQYIHLQYDIKNALGLNVNPTLFINAENLGIIWKATKKELDPEYENGYNMIAPPRYWSFGMRLTF